MTTDFELGSILSGRKRAEGGVHHIDSAIILGEAVEDSSNGKVRVVPYGDVFNPDGDNTVTMTTSPSVKAGDTVQISLVGGVSKRPMVVAVGGEGDRQVVATALAQSTADNAQSAADAAQGTIIDVQTVVNGFEETATGLEASVETITTRLTDYGETITNVKTMFDFGADGLTIGKSDSEMKGTFSNDSLIFTANGQAVLVLNANTSTAVANRFGIGKYQWQSVDNGEAIALVYVG